MLGKVSKISDAIQRSSVAACSRPNAERIKTDIIYASQNEFENT